MTRYLILRLDAPLMSFGDVLVDQIGRTSPSPGASLLTGLIGNALGYEHGDADRLNDLQNRLELGARIDRPGERMEDFQTVSLGQEHLVETGWTTRGVSESRAGASAEGTHIRQREFIADGLVTVALALREPERSPTLDEVQAALRRPARPLFIGRKPCLPSAPIAREIVEAPDLRAALLLASREIKRMAPGPVDLWLPGDGDERAFHITRDRRDWTTQLHGGRRMLRQERVTLEGGEHG